jgi:hypothetical protein
LEVAFNKCLSRGKSIVENAFGILKKTFHELLVTFMFFSFLMLFLFKALMIDVKIDVHFLLTLVLPRVIVIIVVLVVVALVIDVLVVLVVVCFLLLTCVCAITWNVIKINDWRMLRKACSKGVGKFIKIDRIVWIQS